jgi:hypothetical protein
MSKNSQTDPRAPHGYFPAFRQAAGDYYNVDAAIAFLDTPVAPNHQRWRCMLCGWPIDVTGPGADKIGACGCGGCGQTTLRPIAEFDAK